MFPREKIANRLQRDTAVFPFVGEDPKRRGEKGIVAKLVDTNFCCDHRQGPDVPKPGGFASIQKIDQCAIESPNRHGKGQIAQIPQAGSTSLKEKNQEQLGNERPRCNGRGDDKENAVCAF